MSLHSSPIQATFSEVLVGGHSAFAAVHPGARDATEAVIRDSSATWVILVEPGDYSPEDFA